MLTSKVDALFQKVDHLQTTPQGGASSGSFGNGGVCEVYVIQGHIVSECQLGQSFQDLTIKQTSTTFTIDHEITPTPTPSIRVGETTQISPTKILTLLFLTNLHRTTLILLISNIGLLNFNPHHHHLKNLTWRA